MEHREYFEEELSKPATQYFILDTVGPGLHGDIDFIQYQWSRRRYNLVKTGDLLIFRRPGKTSETGKFYFFGAAKMGLIEGDERFTGKLEKAYPFQEYIHQAELLNFEWVWKERGPTWGNFFNQYGMNKITKTDFLQLLSLSDDYSDDGNYDPDAATDASKDIQQGNYYVDDKEGTAKVRSKQQVFSNEVKVNYGNKCAFCLLSTKRFLIGSHIIPWSKRKDIRLDPSNGVCLCTFHDKAFDGGYITIEDNYKISISVRPVTDKVLSEMLMPLHGRLIALPKHGKPNKEYLQYHRDFIFEKFK